MSLYVPLLIQLELKSGAQSISFDDSSSIGVEQSPSIGERTRQRLMSGMVNRRSPGSQGRDTDKDAPLAPGAKHGKANQGGDHVSYRGNRTYSEVVVETLEGDRLTQCSEATSSTRTKARSESPYENDQLSYYFGNPFVEKTEGILHFYKYNDERLAMEAQCRMLCMMGVPSHVTCRDLITFIDPSLNTIEHLKIVRDATPNQYFVIVKFKTHNDTVVFFEEYNGIQYNSFEPEKCSLLFVDKIECVGSDETTDMTGLTEMPTCTVCLERMDDSVLSVLCNHTFHARCLQQWADTTCPVCRFTQTPELVADQRCSDCGQSTDLWICLICGNIGCGRYAEGHANRHFELTSHTFCLQIGGERVWDYAGDNYVHRLIQTDSEGKIVEYARGNGEYAADLDKDDKMESLKMEYTCLLSSQLESQRKYFEARIADVERGMNNMEKMAQAQMDDLERQLSSTKVEVSTLKQELVACQTAKQTAEKKQSQTNQKLAKVTSELAEERSMNEMMRADQQKWKKEIDQLTAQRVKIEKDHSLKVQGMQEHINDLMLHFEAQQKIQEQLQKSNIPTEEVESVHVSSSQENTHSTKSRRRSHKK